MKKGSFLLLIAAVSSLGGLLFGYDTGVINGAQFQLTKFFELSDALKDWVVGSALLGCLVGAIVAVPLSIKIGRKWSIQNLVVCIISHCNFHYYNEFDCLKTQ